MKAPFFAMTSALLAGSTPVMLRLRTERFSVFLIDALKLSGGLLALTPIVWAIDPSWFHSLTLRAVSLVALTAFTGPVIAWSSYIKAIKKTDVSVAHPIMSSYPTVAILLDFLFFGVTPSLYALLGFFSIIIGLAALTKSSREKKRSLKGLPFAFFTLILWGINSFLFKIILFDISPLSASYLRVIFAVPMIWIVVFILRDPKRELRLEGIRGAYLPLLAGMINDAASMFFFFSAIAIGPLYAVLPISGTSPFFSGLLSLAVLKEPVGKTRFLGIILVVLGISLITFSR